MASEGSAGPHSSSEPDSSRTNALWALRRVAEVWGGEVTPVITVANGRVATRSIRLDAERGSWNGLRFTYGKNMAWCTRTVLEQDVYTALYGFGTGLPFTDEEGNYKAGYRRKLTFGEVNGGVNWVGDENARLVWGRWNADRTVKVHSFGQVTMRPLIVTSQYDLANLEKRIARQGERESARAIVSRLGQMCHMVHLSGGDRRRR